MKLNRKYITPLITLTFVITGISGIMMFFHIMDGYTEVLHEFMGLFLVILSILHIIVNWEMLKKHFKKKIFWVTILVSPIISALFVVQQQANPKVDTIIMERIVKSPIPHLFNALQVDSLETVKRLEDYGVSLEGAKILEDLWINNDVRPEKVIDLITE
jgi:Na+/melibiose symporter-like transporter